MNVDQSFELLRADIDAHVRRRVSEAVGGLQQRVAALRGLAGALEATGDLSIDAGQDRLEETAACIRALATEALTSTVVCIGISERIRAYASVRGIVGATSNSADAAEGPIGPESRPSSGRRRSRRKRDT